jgi:hypothetical protein
MTKDEALKRVIKFGLLPGEHMIDDDDDTQVYKKPWVGLTDEERDAITNKVIGFNSCCGWEDDYAKAIEAKLKEKNT